MKLPKPKQRTVTIITPYEQEQRYEEEIEKAKLLKKKK